MPDTSTQTPPQQSSVTGLVSGILDDAQNLFKQHVAMVRAEFKEDLNRTKQAAQLLGAGGLVAFMGGLLLLIAAVHGLAVLAPELPHWACWAIIGGIVTVVGVCILAAGHRILEVLNPLPEKSIQALEEDFTWKTKTKLPK